MKRLGPLFAVLFLAGCSHNGISTAMLPSATGPAAAALQTSVRFVIKVPSRYHRRDHYISPTTKSISIKVYNAAHTSRLSTTLRNLTPASSGCVIASSATTCTFGVPAPSGHDTFDVTTYDQPEGTGHALSALIDYPFAVVKGKTNAMRLTLGGLVASFDVVAVNRLQTTISASSISIYGNKPQQLTIVPLDADGNTIVGAGAVTPRIDATPSATTLTVSGSNAWTLTSTYTGAMSPTTPGNSTLSITATPFPGSGATTLHKSVALKLYDPWICVMDYTNRQVYAYDEYGTSKSIYTGQGINGGYAASYVPATNWIYVSNNVTNSRMVVLDATGHPVTPSASMPFPNLNLPYQSAYDSHNGLLYVTNYGNSTITAYDAQGNQQTTPSPHFNFNSFLNAPDAIAFDPHNNFLYIANAGNSTAAAYNETSIQETDQTSTFKNLSTPSGIAFDPNNNLIYISNEGLANSGITVYNESGQQQTPSGTFSGAAHPGGVAYDPYDGMLYVTNYSAGTVIMYDEQGNEKALNVGTFSGLKNPWGIFVIP